MSNRKKIVVALAVFAVLASLYWALRPAAVPVDVVSATVGDFVEYVEDEGRTRLREPYVVSAPIAGYLRRVELEVGDRVERGEALFRLEPMPAPALDARSLEQAREMVTAAEARLESARAMLEARNAERRLADNEYERVRQLDERGFATASRVEQALSGRDAARAAERAAEHAVTEARTGLESARLVLAIASGERVAGDREIVAMPAPVSGTVLVRHRCCEGAVAAGEPILEIGDLNGLEVVVDLLSMDAVRVRPGMRVVIDRWGGDEALEGRVRRVEPSGFTRVSALGVEEQRVRVLVDLISPREDWTALGEGYRVEARFILWEGEDVLQVPTSALFRDDDRWTLFVVDGGRARLRPVTPGRHGGLRTQIVDGLHPGESVISHPGDRVADGVRVDAGP